MMEGNPEIKGRVRRMQREMARRRMMQDVARATVVITNPTHFAVALEYRRDKMAAPIVLAKGADQSRCASARSAREHGVPIIENKPLAQALYRTAEIGETIPGAALRRGRGSARVSRPHQTADAVTWPPDHRAPSRRTAI